MDKEIADKMQQVVGQMNCLDAMAKGVHCMPSDRATVTILDAIRALTDKAVLSAALYAHEQMKASTGDSGQ